MVFIIIKGKKMKLFKIALGNYFWKLHSNSRIYKYLLGVLLVINIWYIQRNREVYFSGFAFSLADGYVLSINRWMSVLAVYPLIFFTTLKILESTYSVQHILKTHSLRKTWCIQLIQCMVNAIIMSLILMIVVYVANLDSMNNMINFSLTDSIFAFYNKGYTSETIKIWHVITAYVVCETVVILSGSMLICFLNIFFSIKSSLLISGVLLAGEMFLGSNILGISNINISYFMWYPKADFHLERAILIVILEMILGFVFIRKKDILYGKAEIF